MVEVVVDYATLDKDALIEELGRLYNEKPDGWTKSIGKISGLIAKAEAVEAKAAKDKLQAVLQGVTKDTRDALMKVISKLTDEGKLEGAEGVWFSYDFGEIQETGINPACRLIKSGRKASDGGTSKSSYVSNPTPSKELLAQVGSDVMFEEDTERTINKEAVTMPAGMTFQEAYDYSTNGGWRNSVRMALLKQAGLV